MIASRLVGLVVLACAALINSARAQPQIAAYEQDFRQFRCDSDIKPIDLDGDGRRDCLFLERQNGKPSDEYKVWVYLSSKRIWNRLHDVSHGSETKISTIDLSKYSHPGFSVARTSAKFAYRIADYERSSRLYYFDKSLERVVVFWESD